MVFFSGGFDTYHTPPRRGPGLFPPKHMTNRVLEHRFLWHRFPSRISYRAPKNIIPTRQITPFMLHSYCLTASQTHRNRLGKMEMRGRVDSHFPPAGPIFERRGSAHVVGWQRNKQSCPTCMFAPLHIRNKQLQPDWQQAMLH